MDIIAEKGVVKTNTPFYKQFILSFIAGSMIAIGFIPTIKLYQDISPAVGVLLGSLFFPIGLIVILFIGGELVTGNMTVIGISYLCKKCSFKDMFLNWLKVFFGNIVGVLFTILVLGFGSGLLIPYQETVLKLANSKLTISPMQALISGIGCNWLIGLSILFFNKYEDGFVRLVGVYFPVAVFVLIGFQHCVANVVLFAYPVLSGLIPLQSALINVVYVFLGNVLGGFIFTGLLYKLSSHV